MTSRILLILFCVFELLNPCIAFSETYVKQGFAVSNYAYKDGIQVEVSLRHRLSFFGISIPKLSYSTVTHIQFVGLGIKNIKTNSELLSEMNSKHIPLNIRTTSAGYKNDWPRNATWFPWDKPISGKNENSYGIDSSESCKLPDPVPFNDLEISGSILFFDSNGTQKRKLDLRLLLIRDYKTDHESLFEQEMTRAITAIIPDNWGIQPPVLGTYRFAEGSHEVMYAIRGSKKIGYASVEHYGEITIENGEIVFNENPEKRIVSYIKHDGYERDEKTGRIIRKTKKVYLDPTIAPYKTIYEWGYKSPE